MLFSIVVPVYNVEKYVEECLDSLVNQSCDDYEIILINDGSTDSSGIICNKYAAEHQNIKVIHKANEGLLMARRTGIKECRGEYILHCDSDDYIAKDTLEKLKNVIDKKHPDMVMYGYDVVDDSQSILEKHYSVFQNLEEFNANNKERILNELASTTWLNNMVTKATRRECVDIDADYTEYKEIKMGEDLFQVIPLIRKCSTFIYIAKPFYFYRSNPEGMSKNIDKSYLNNRISVSNKMYHLLKDENVSETTLVNFYNRYVKDLLKYLLRFTKAGIDKSEFKEIFQIVENNSIYKDAQRYHSKWQKSNKLMKVIIKPGNYMIVNVLARLFLSNRL